MYMYMCVVVKVYSELANFSNCRWKWHLVVYKLPWRSCDVISSNLTLYGSSLHATEGHSYNHNHHIEHLQLSPPLNCSRTGYLARVERNKSCPWIIPTPCVCVNYLGGHGSMFSGSIAQKLYLIFNVVTNRKFSSWRIYFFVHWECLKILLMCAEVWSRFGGICWRKLLTWQNRSRQ